MDSDYAMNQQRRRTTGALPKLLTVREAGQILGISVSKLYELVASHQLPAFRPGGRIRISEDAIRAYLEQTRVS